MSIYNINVRKSECGILVTTNEYFHPEMYSLPCKVEQKYAVLQLNKATNVGLSSHLVYANITSNKIQIINNEKIIHYEPKISWKKAQAHCQTLSANLISVHSKWAVKEVMNILPANSYFPAIYIGLKIKVSK